MSISKCSDVCTNDPKKRWKGNIIPYKVGNVSPELKKSVMEAMKEITSKSSIIFVEKTNQADYIKIVDEGEYWSYVGKQGGEQKLSVTKNWPHPVGSAIHELMHVLGFHHEHCRPDRDEVLNVEGNDENYKKLSESSVQCYGPYDCKSIMHYSLHRWINLKPGVEIDPDIGQRRGLSKGDIEALNRLYPHEHPSFSREYSRTQGDNRASHFAIHAAANFLSFTLSVSLPLSLFLTDAKKIKLEIRHLRVTIIITPHVTTVRLNTNDLQSGDI